MHAYMHAYMLTEQLFSSLKNRKKHNDIPIDGASDQVFGVIKKLDRRRDFWVTKHAGDTFAGEEVIDAEVLVWSARHCVRTRWIEFDPQQDPVRSHGTAVAFLLLSISCVINPFKRKQHSCFSGKSLHQKGKLDYPTEETGEVDFNAKYGCFLATHNWIVLNPLDVELFFAKLL